MSQSRFRVKEVVTKNGSKEYYPQKLRNIPFTKWSIYCYLFLNNTKTSRSRMSFWVSFTFRTSAMSYIERRFYNKKLIEYSYYPEDFRSAQYRNGGE